MGIYGFVVLVVKYTVNLETVHAILNTCTRRVQRLSSDAQRVHDISLYMTAQMSAFSHK